MTTHLSVCDVDWDGSHFTARSEAGSLEGVGDCHLNPASTGGTITGTIQRGPMPYIGKQVEIEFDSNLGVCVFTEDE